MTRVPLKPTTPTSDLFVEWTPKLQARKGLMVPQDSLGSFSRLPDAGLRSVYLFEEKDANAIKSSGSSKGFSQYAVWSNCLFIDIDGGVRGLVEALRALPPVGFELYESGSKGFHLHIPHSYVYGPIPEAHADWVESHGIVADFSIYRRNSIIRLPGCVHPKTKQKKRLLMIVDGPEPEFWQPILKAPVQKMDDLTDSADILMRAARLAESQPKSGFRHTALWSLAEGMQQAGFSLDTTTEIMHKVNESWPNPKDPDDVVRAAQQAFKRTLK